MAASSMNDPVTATMIEQKRWSLAADKLKKEYAGWRRWVFGLTIAGAVFATASGQVPETVQPWLAGAGAIVLAIAPFLNHTKLSPERMRDWVRARSVSEALKAEIYLCQTRSADYAEGNALARLVEKRNEFLKAADDLVEHTADVPEPQVTAPPPMGIDQYIADRLAGQIKWYRRKAGENQRLVRRFRTAEFALGLLAAGFGALGGLVSEAAVSSWVAVITTVLGAVTAHAAAGRYEYIVTSYISTASRLEALRDGWTVREPADKTPETASRFVRECEEAISVENQGWMAKWMKGAKPEAAAS